MLIVLQYSAPKYLAGKYFHHLNLFFRKYDSLVSSAIPFQGFLI